jgi:gamma-glutamyltranspeptidase/glutathione hydrolase
LTKVVVCPQPKAAEAGMEILKKGGNAVDAVVAGAIAQGITNPMINSLCGAGQMNIYMVKNKKPIFSASDAGAGSRAHPDVYEYEDRTGYSDEYTGPVVKNREDYIGYKASKTPDLIQVLYDNHKKFGVIPWKDCLQPAIRLAKEGFIIENYLTRFLSHERRMPYLTATKAMAELFLKDGRPYREGELLVQRDAGRTLEKVAKYGADIFFRGEIAEKIAEDFEENGGLFTLEDLNDVKTLWYEPLSSTYRGHTFYVNVPPSGGAFKLEILNILEGFELKKLGWNTPEYLDIMARAMNMALADCTLYSVDPIYDPESMDNARMLISKEYARKMIDLIKTGGDKEYPAPVDAPYHDTTSIVTLDDDGNCVSMKHSSGGGSGVVTPGVGIVHNNNMAGSGMWIDHKRTKGFGFGPKMKTFGGMSPTLGFKDGMLFSASGSPMGHQGYMCEIQALLNVIDFGFRLQAAISSPRIISGTRKGEIWVESNFPHPYPWKNLEKMGHIVTVSPYTGRVSALIIDPKTGFVDVGTDPRGGAGLAKED